MLWLGDGQAATDLQLLFRAAGVTGVCEGAAPMLVRVLDEPNRRRVGQVFAPQRLCEELEARVRAEDPESELQQVEALFASAQAVQFNDLERKVADDPTDFSAYREQLAKQQPRPARQALIRRLDIRARTSQLAALLRGEVAKTLMFLEGLAHGETLDESTLSALQTPHKPELEADSRARVEIFMLYAYRNMPDDRVEGYLQIYEDARVQRFLDIYINAVPQVFAVGRRNLVPPAPTLRK